MRWLADEVQDVCSTLWNSNVALTVDETMICYKAKYSPIRHNRPIKSTKFGVKLWIFGDAWSRYALNF